MPLKDPTKSAASKSGGVQNRLARWMVGLILACVVLVSLAGLSLVMMPVSLFTRNINLTPAVVAVYGSARDGRAVLKGGYRLSWQTQVRGLPLPHLATTLLLQGDDTHLTGIARTGPTGFALAEVDGRAGPGLAKLVPGAWACGMTAKVSNVQFGWWWRKATASGAVSTPAGDCIKGASQIKIPPLTIKLQSVETDALATLQRDGEVQLAAVRVGRDRILGIRIEADAADIFAQLPRGGPINLQLPF